MKPYQKCGFHVGRGVELKKLRKMFSPPWKKIVPTPVHKYNTNCTCPLIPLAPHGVMKCATHWQWSNLHQKNLMGLKYYQIKLKFLL